MTVPQWFVISTKPRREEYALDQLRRRGVETFLPRIVEPSRLVDRVNVAPLFPGYLFARLDLATQYFQVVWTPGVRKLIGFGDAPCPVDDAVVDFLRVRMGAEGVLRPAALLREGDTVRVRRGPLEGLVGIIEHPGCGRGRVRVLMELLRRQTRVEVPLHILERVSA